jgi:peptidoglycan/LPS O-acetylase OafA/YrhL
MSNKNNINFAILGLSIVFSYLLPIHIHPLRTFYQDAIVILGLLLAILSLSLNGQLKLRFNGLSLIGIGLASCILCQFFWNIRKHWKICLFLACICCYFLLLILLGHPCRPNPSSRKNYVWRLLMPTF